MQGSGRTGMGAVLFTDLVGSTAIRSRVGDQVADEIRRRHDELIIAAIERSGGHVLKHLGDGVMATFGAAGDAVAAAVACQQSIARHNAHPTAGEALAIRVGASVGDIEWTDDDCFGTPVVEAARLCDAAEGGQILVASVVRVLAGSRTDAVFSEVGPLALKGLATPLDVVEVGWDQPTTSVVPLPAPIAGGRAGYPLVGRSTEISGLEGVWETVSAGSRSAVLLAGEAGAGKTRLAAEFAGRVHDAGGTVLFGRSDESLHVPYQPIVECLRHLVSATDDGRLVELLGRFPGEIVRLLPELAERPVELPPPLVSEPDVEQYRLFEAVTSMLQASAGIGQPPLLLLLDDLHWADSPSCQLLRHVMERLSDVRLMILITYRDDEVARDQPMGRLVADLRRQTGVHFVPVEGLGPEPVDVLLRSVLGDHLDAERSGLLSSALCERTEGNAFFLSESVRHIAHLAMTGDLTDIESATFEVPASVRDVVWGRLQQLDAGTQSVLQVAAVMGQQFDPRVVGATDGLDPETVVEAIAAAEERSVVGPAGYGRYQFSHALLQEAIYEDLGAMARTLMHLRIAQAIEAVDGEHLGARSGELAHHYERAAPAADVARTIRYRRLAGEHALEQFAHHEAVGHLQAALDRLADIGGGDPVELTELGVLLGRAQLGTGDPSSRATLVRAARSAGELGAGAVMVEALNLVSRGVPSLVGGVDTEIVELLESALDVIGESPSGDRARLLALLSGELSYAEQDERRLRYLAQAEEIAEEVDDRLAMALAALIRSATTFDVDFLATDVRRLAQECNRPTWEGVGEIFEGVMCAFRGEFEAAAEAIDRAAAIAEEIGEQRLEWSVLQERAHLAMIHGDLEGAERFAEEALALGTSLQMPDAPALYASQILAVRWLGGRSQEMAYVVDVPYMAESRIPAIMAVRAMVACESGDFDTARAILEDLSADGFAGLLPAAVNPVVGVGVAACACAELGDAEMAEVLYELLRPFPGTHVSTMLVWLAPTTHCLGLVCGTTDRHDEAVAHYDDAIGTYLDLGHDIMAARVKTDLARVLTGRDGDGDAERVTRLLGEAIAVASEHDLPMLRERAEAVAAGAAD